MLLSTNSVIQTKILEKNSIKKYWSYLIIAEMLMLFLSGCGRDLSTPSSRLVGHWADTENLKIEYYFSRIDSKTNEGTIIVYKPSDGSVSTGKYTIVSETPSEQKVTLNITMWWSNGDEFVDYMVKEDGTTAILTGYVNTRINYVDSKTKP
jgi:hypothetical protein